MNILIVTLGSHGDVHPFCGLGVALAGRGHNVTILANEYFHPLIKTSGLTPGPPVGSAEDFVAVTQRPELWHRVEGTRVVLASVAQSLSIVYDQTAQFVRDNRDCVVVTSSLGLAVRCARDKFRFPLATVHLQPSVIRSVHAPPKLPGLYIPRWMPRWMRRQLWALADRVAIDPMIAPALNAFRADHGLPPVRRVMNAWWHSPDRIIGLWPDWFAPPQSDWPPQTILTGFPLWDERGLAPMPDDVRRFLDAGAPPIAFTPGSAMRHGHSFFAAAADACRRLGRRGILLTRHPEQLPPTLPDGVIQAPFVPLSELLPRCAALVHHGGIGTLSQALRAGIPQLVMPMNHDQPDNAHRALRLGVAMTIKQTRFTVKNVATALDHLLTDQSMHDRCAQIARRFNGVDALANSSAIIEQLSARTQQESDPRGR